MFQQQLGALTTAPAIVLSISMQMSSKAFHVVRPPINDRQLELYGISERKDKIQEKVP